MCLLCENSLSFILVICILSVYIVFFNTKFKNKQSINEHGENCNKNWSFAPNMHAPHPTNWKWLKTIHLWKTEAIQSFYSSCHQLHLAETQRQGAEQGSIAVRKREGFRCAVFGAVGTGGRGGLAGREASNMISLGSTFGFLWLGLSWKPRPKKKKKKEREKLEVFVQVLTVLGKLLQSYGLASQVSCFRSCRWGFCWHP